VGSCAIGDLKVLVLIAGKGWTSAQRLVVRHSRRR
jgi:hypothetical protein